MKKLFLLTLVSLSVLSARAGGVAALVDDFFHVGIFCDTKQSTFIGNKAESLKNVKVLGDVSATGELMTVLCVVTMGDVSMRTLKDMALRQYSEADDIINVEVDNEVFGIVGCVYKRVRVTLRGKAVRYKK